MKKFILLVLISMFLGISNADCTANANGFSVNTNTMPYYQPRTVNVMRMNTMSPATYKYPQNYTHHQTVYRPNFNYSIPNNVSYNVPNGQNINNIIYVGTPVYVMRSGMVRVKHRPRQGRIGTREYDYYDY